MPESSFTWDVAAARYRGPSGKFVPDAAVREAVSAVTDASTARLVALAEQLRTGGIDLARWQQGMAAEMKRGHLAAAMAAHGGQAQMSAADYGYVGQRLRVQYAYLRQFAADVASGAQPLNGTLRTRASLYGEASRNTFSEALRRDQRNRGGREERWVLTSGESCSGCVSQAGRGWVPVGTLPAIGSQQCRTRCRCRVLSRTSQEAA